MVLSLATKRMSFFNLIGVSIGVCIGGIGLMLSPKIFDFNSPRQILKFKNIHAYFEKQKEYCEIVQRIGEMSRHPEEATSSSIAMVLTDLRNSPFYNNNKYRPAYENLWILQANKLSEIDKSQLRGQNPCRSKESDKCTKGALLLELYLKLAADGEWMQEIKQQKDGKTAF